MSRAALGWLGALGVGLGAIIAAEIAGGGPARLNTATLRPIPENSRTVQQPADGTESRRVTSILVRPLFARSRRPPQGAKSAGGAFRLAGVIIGPSEREAIFEPQGGGKPVVAKEGETVGGATVRAIAPGMVLMVDATGTHVMTPSFAPAPAGAAAQGRLAPPRFGPAARPRVPK